MNENPLATMLRDGALSEPISAPWPPQYTHTANGRTWRLYGCAKRGCDKVNPDYATFGAGDKNYCLGHIPLRTRLRLWLRRGD